MSKSNLIQMPLQDPSDLLEIFSDWRGTTLQLSAGRLEGSLCVYSDKQIRVFDLTHSQTLINAGRDNTPGYSFVLVDRENINIRFRGRQVHAGSILIKPSAREYRNVLPANSRTTGAIIEQTAFDQTAVRLGFDINRVDLLQTFAIRPDPKTFHRLLARLRSLTHSARAPDSTDEAQLATYLVELALKPPADVGPVFVKSRPNAELVADVIDLMHAREGMISSAEVNAATAVSDRTLRKAFALELGVSPMAYARLIRLHKVRRTLFHAEASKLNIAKLLTKEGFHRPSTFSSEYRAKFGELPSATLRKRRAS